MTDRVTICNLVLALAGTPYVIVDPDDEGREASVLRMAWDMARRATIRGSDDAAAPKWNFATRFFDLAARAIGPGSKLPYGFAAAYPFAQDHLRLVELTLNGDALRGWKVADGEILAQVRGPLRVECLVDVPEVADWDASFTDTFTYGLAKMVVNTLGGSTALRRELDDEYVRKLKGAARVDACEDPPTEPVECDWVIDRYRSGRRYPPDGRFDDGPGHYASLVAGRG